MCSSAQVKHQYGHGGEGGDLPSGAGALDDPAAKRVVTNGGTDDADVLVVALGADIDTAVTPGLDANVLRSRGPRKLRQWLAALSRGRVLVSILGAPYKCPPAPFEVALQLHDFFERRGVREHVAIQITSPAPTPLPVSKEGSVKLLELMAERGITFTTNTLVTSRESAEDVALTKAGDRLAYDLFLGVPVHRAPKAVVSSGLAPSGGWVAVDPHTMETRFRGVYAIGDVTTVPVGQGAVPKAGAFADRAARAVADDIVNRVRGTGPRGRFDGTGTCYLEFGEGRVAMIDANFLGGPSPSVSFIGPSPDFLPQKTAFARDRIVRWFGR